MKPPRRGAGTRTLLSQRAGPAGSLRSDRQTLAALGASGVDDGAAATGLHAHEETVRAGTPRLRGLVGTLHGSSFRGKPVIVMRKCRPDRDPACWPSGDQGREVGRHGLALIPSRSGETRTFARSSPVSRAMSRPARCPSPVPGKPPCPLPTRESTRFAAGPIDLKATPDTRFRASGEPAIRAKTPFPVKHLHHNSRRSAALDGGRRTVDNHGPPNPEGGFYGGSQKKISTEYESLHR